MIDLHNHVLPGCDDGAKDIEESLSMLRVAHEQGITDVVNTIHFQHPKMPKINTDYDYLLSVKNNLQERLINENIDIKLHLGAEVFFNFNLLDILDNKLTTFGNMKYMLIEFHTLSLPKDFENHLYKLVVNGITPIIAHPERYKPVQNDLTIIERLINSGCIVQVDAGSMLGHFGEKCKITSILLLKKNMVSLIGSDAHNNRKRNFCLINAHKIAKKILGKRAFKLVNDNPKKIIQGERLDPPDVIYDYNIESNYFFKFFFDLFR